MDYSSGFLNSSFPELRIIFGGYEGTMVSYGDIFACSVTVLVIYDGVFRPGVFVGIPVKRDRCGEYDCQSNKGYKN